MRKGASFGQVGESQGNFRNFFLKSLKVRECERKF